MHSEFTNTLRPIAALGARGIRLTSLRDGSTDEGTPRGASVELVASR